MKFLIKQRTSNQQFQEGLPVYQTGDQAYKRETCILRTKEIGEGKVKYITGFDEGDISNSNDLTSDERKAYLKAHKNAVKAFVKAYDEECLDGKNVVFWKNHSIFKIEPEQLDQVYDDENIDHLVLRWNIISSAFPAIAANEQAAIRRGKPFYMVELKEHENKQYDKKYGGKIEAISALNEIITKEDKESLIQLSWYLDDKTSKGFTRSTSETTLKEYLLEYIEGGDTDSKKKKRPQEFLDAYSLWKADKESVMLVSLYNIAKHFSLLSTSKGMIGIRSTGMELGKNKEKAIETLGSPMNREELQELQEEANKKLNNE